MGLLALFASVPRAVWAGLGIGLAVIAFVLWVDARAYDRGMDDCREAHARAVAAWQDANKRQVADATGADIARRQSYEGKVRTIRERIVVNAPPNRDCLSADARGLLDAQIAAANAATAADKGE